MHQINLSTVIADPPLHAGSFLASDSASAEILAYNPASCKLTTPAFYQKQFRRDLDWNGKSILVARLGAGGDLVMTTPAIHHVKKLWPNCAIDFACLPRLAPILTHNPDIRKVINHPIEVSVFNSYDSVVWLDDNYVEEMEFGKTIPAVDLVCKRFGFDPSECVRNLVYVVIDEERVTALARFPLGKRKRIGIQISASEPARSWPKEHLHEFSKLAINKGYDVYWFGWPGETGAGATAPPNHLIDLTRCDPPLSLRESAAALSTMDAVVAPDSLWYHVASALNLPGVGLFGAFPSALRETSTSMFNINGPNARRDDDEPCSPCFHHSGRPGVHEFPTNGPCSRVGYCCVLSAIAPDRVLSLVERKMAEKSEAQ